MFKLKLHAKNCISCGICMDVCTPRAIAMGTNLSKSVEGSILSNLYLNTKGNDEKLPEKMMTFPYLACPQLCDGCANCVNECPVAALEIQSDKDALV